MSVRILSDHQARTDGAALYDSVTGIAFGPVFTDREEAEAFLESLTRDARTYSSDELTQIRADWLEQRDAGVA